MVTMLLPSFSRSQMRAQRIKCLADLKQIGLAYHSFLHDHENRFPMQVPAREGGTEEYVNNGYRVNGDFYFSYRHFQALSNDLAETKLLVCPSDLARSPARDFFRLRSEHLSYLVGVNADYSKPKALLAADRNLTNEQTGSGTIIQTGIGAPWRWTSEMHRFKGNLLFADGHVDEHNTLYLAGRDLQPGNLVLPTLCPSSVAKKKDQSNDRASGLDGKTVQQP